MASSHALVLLISSTLASSRVATHAHKTPSRRGALPRGLLPGPLPLESRAAHDAVVSAANASALDILIYIACPNEYHADCDAGYASEIPNLLGTTGSTQAQGALEAMMVTVNAYLDEASFGSLSLAATYVYANVDFNQATCGDYVYLDSYGDQAATSVDTMCARRGGPGLALAAYDFHMTGSLSSSDLSAHFTAAGKLCMDWIDDAHGGEGNYWTTATYGGTGTISETLLVDGTPDTASISDATLGPGDSVVLDAGGKAPGVMMLTVAVSTDDATNLHADSLTIVGDFEGDAYWTGEETFSKMHHAETGSCCGGAAAAAGGRRPAGRRAATDPPSATPFPSAACADGKYRYKMTFRPSVAAFSPVSMYWWGEPIEGRPVLLRNESIDALTEYECLLDGMYHVEFWSPDFRQMEGLYFSIVFENGGSFDDVMVYSSYSKYHGRDTYFQTVDGELFYVRPPSPAPTLNLRPTFPEIVASPTAGAATVAGDLTISGLSLADAEANAQVFAEAIADAAGVTWNRVTLTFAAAAARRRLSADVTVAYEIAVLAGEDASAVTAAIGATSASDMDALIASAAAEEGASATFAAVSTTAISEATVDQGTDTVDAAAGPRGAEPNPPNWPETVAVFDETSTAEAIEAAVAAAYATNGGPGDRGQFGAGRFAFLFKPGEYAADVPVGYYTQVLGLGARPGDVSFVGARGVYCVEGSSDFAVGALNTFWRGAENFRMAPTRAWWTGAAGALWAASQASPLRRVDVDADLLLFQYERGDAAGYASGGFVADSVPSARGPDLAVARRAPTARRAAAEKPYVRWAADTAYELVVPARRSDAAGPSWVNGDDGAATVVGFDRVYVADASEDDAASLNAKLAAGLSLVLSPGIYDLDAPLVVATPGQCVLGLGLATLRGTDATAGALVSVEAPGARVAGLILEAGPAPLDALLAVAAAATGTALFDIYARSGRFREGAAEAGKVDTMVAVDADGVLGDNVWLWRADHDAEGLVYDGANAVANGLRVAGDDATFYGLAVEHQLEDLVVWEGDNGTIFFYQSELPYDVDSYDFAAYRVAPGVDGHVVYNPGVYANFRDHPVVAPSGFVGNATWVNPTTVFLNGEGSIASVLNGAGDAVGPGLPQIARLCGARV
ncbi:hypothetical protein SO694_00025039 [Aureococcus anophagefferens]|uniref:Uncharacterized protein n=1 Tax=Aureococcus anophagefferens TaxID=44056 RepID=A0ABR1FV79_AURAN